MSVLWRTQKKDESDKHDMTIMAAFSDGSISQYILPIGKTIWTHQEDNNGIFCMDQSPDQRYLVTAGSDCSLRLYDSENMDEPTILATLDASEPEHAERVFSVQFLKEDPNIILSGGWDNTIKIFDISQGGPIGHIFGPSLSGDSVDIFEDKMVTGSYRPEDSLQVWDWKKNEKVQTIDWEYGTNYSDNAYLNFARFNKTGKLIVAGGKNQEVKTFVKTINQDTLQEEPNFSMHMRQGNFGESVYCCRFMNNADSFAVGCGDGTVKIFNVTTTYH